MILSVGDSDVDEAGIFWLLSSGKNEGRVGRGILRLVFANCCNVVRCVIEGLGDVV